MEMLETARVSYQSLQFFNIYGIDPSQVNSARQPSFISEGLDDQNYGVSEKELAYIGGTISQTPDTVSIYHQFRLVSRQLF